MAVDQEYKNEPVASLYLCVCVHPFLRCLVFIPSCLRNSQSDHFLSFLAGFTRQQDDRKDTFTEEQDGTRVSRSDSNGV